MTVKQNFNNGTYLIEIIKDNKEYNLNKNDICLANFKMLRKCSEELWDRIINSDLDNNKYINNDDIDEKINSDSEVSDDSINEERGNSVGDLNKKFRSLSI